MGGSKMIPEISHGVKPPPKLLWSPMIERPEDEAARLAQIKTPKDSFHQVAPETYPCSPFKYRTRLYSFNPRLIQPTIVEQPDLSGLKKRCSFLKKMEKAKSKSIRKKSQFLLSKFIKSAVLKQREIFFWDETFKPERIQVLIKTLASPVELEQLYAAQALGQLGTDEESVISALYNIVEECDETPLQYEAARSLALLDADNRECCTAWYLVYDPGAHRVGCLETCVMKVLIRHLKVASLNRIEDTLAALKVVLQAWSTTPSFEYHSIGAQSSLTRNLKRLVNLQQPLDSITFNAAICLAYLDKSSLIAQETMFMFLTHVERKKKFKALIMLVKHMGVMNAIIIRKVLDHLEHSPVYKHRADATDLLITIGLEIIEQEDLEEDVFIVLIKKVSEEPFLIVRQKVALAIEELKMKMRAWEVVERQLKDEDHGIRKQAVVALGVLGIRHTDVLLALLEMLELDTNEAVRIQIIKAFSTLGVDNINVRRSLKRKKQGGGILGSESIKALESLDQRSEIQRELMVHSFILQ